MATIAGETIVYEEVTVGFSPHVRSGARGDIDWTAGCILAKGHGFGGGKTNQEMLLARRAAVLDAAANALAIAAGIDVDAHGRAGDIRNGRRRLEGRIKGQRIVGESWRPELDPPRYDVTMRVPLWGVKSVATLFRMDSLQRMARSRSRRLPLVLSNADVSDTVLVIDARGTSLNPCLFPAVVTDKGDTLYDVTTITATAANKPPIRYVESDLSFEDIQAAIENGIDILGVDDQPVVRLAAARPAEKHEPNNADTNGSKASKADNHGKRVGDAQKDAKKKKHRRRRRRAVKAVKADGANKTRIVLTAEDAEKLRKDGKSANLLRNAEIVVVVDSAAAGIQGRLDGPPNETVLAFARMQ